MTVIARSETSTSILQLLEQALEMIDQSDAPAHIGAHLDLALCQLREHLQTILPSKHGAARCL